MKNITTNKLQTELSKVIREVQSGEVFQVSRYSEPVAYLINEAEYKRLVSGKNCKKCVDEIKEIVRKQSAAKSNKG